MRRLVALGLVLGACVSTPAPSETQSAAPSAARPTPAPAAVSTSTPSTRRATPAPFGGIPGLVTITGTVIERDTQGARPVSGSHVSVWVEFIYSGGYHWMTDVTDATGRYELWGIPTGSSVVLYAGKVGYVQPCAQRRATSADATIDIELVAVSAGGAAASAVARRGGGPLMSGSVFEQRPETRLPLGNAMVWLGGDLVTATTITDPEGRYLLCAVPLGTNDVTVTAKGFKNAGMLVTVNGDMTVDFEMKH